MDLPVHIHALPGDEPVFSVDGAFDAPGLNLSHWPGNRTPAGLRHDLSTGIALNFARLDEAQRERLAEGCTALVNNHYDTDGVLAMLTVRSPALALAHEDLLLAAAATGDLFACPSEHAFVIDCVVTAMADPVRSPIAAELAGLADEARWERATVEMLERLPSLLKGDVEPYRDLWAAEWEDLQADRVDLDNATVDDLVHLDFVLWTATTGSRSTRTHRPAQCFDPGRHALWGRTQSDRLLVLGPGSEGTTARFLIGTRSFFDMVTRRAPARPDLAELAAALNQLEGCATAAPCAWRHQLQEGASPELWFGRAHDLSFAEHVGEYLAPSNLGTETVKSAVVDALRSSWAFPEDVL